MTDRATQPDVVAFLTERVARRLRRAPDAIDRDADLIELGIESIDAVLISGDLEDRYGIELDPVLLFECRTIRRVADRVMDALSAR